MTIAVISLIKLEPIFNDDQTVAYQKRVKEWVAQWTDTHFRGNYKPVIVGAAGNQPLDRRAVEVALSVFKQRFEQALVAQSLKSQMPGGKSWIFYLEGYTVDALNQEGKYSIEHSGSFEYPFPKFGGPL